MPTVFSPWRNLDSHGNIPAELLPASMWQLEFYVQASWDTSLGIDTKQTDVHWHWQILDAAGNIYFDQTVDQSGVATTLDVLSTWFPNNPHIHTIVPSPPPANEQGYCTEVDLNGYGWDGGNSFTLTFYYNADAYRTPLPAGCHIKVTQIGGTETYILKYGLIRIRTVAGGGVTALYRKQDGTFRIVRSGGTGLQFVSAGDLRAASIGISDALANPYSTAPAPTNPVATFDLGAGDSPLLLRLKGHILYLWHATTGLYFRQTWADGSNWSDPLFIANMQPAGITLSGTGSTILAIGTASPLVSGGDATVNGLYIATGDTYNNQPVYKSPSGLYLFASDTTPHWAVSKTVGGKVLYAVSSLGTGAQVIRCAFERDLEGNVYPRVVDAWTPVMTDGSAFPALPTSLQWMYYDNGLLHLLMGGGTGVNYYQSQDEGRTWLH